MRLAEEAGLEGAGELLEGDEWEEGVEQEAAKWRRRYGVSGVPFFIFNGGVQTLSGAQDPAALEATMRKVMDSSRSRH